MANAAANLAGWSEALAAAPVEVYKTDARSRVWRVEAAGRSLVIKRFKFSPLRQRLAVLLGLHPGQRELRLTRRLADLGLPVTPILAAGCQGDGAGCRYVLITPWAGISLLWRLRDGKLRGPQKRRETIRALADTIAKLVTAGYVHRDLKTSNVLVADDGTLRLIDLGAVRRWCRHGQLVRMLAVLDRTACRDGASRTDRLRCLKALAKQAPRVGQWKPLARAVIGQSMLR